MLQSYSAPLEWTVKTVKAEDWRLPALMLVFFAGHFLVYLLQREQRYKLELRRSSPALPRKRAKEKAARQQRVRNQRRR